MVLYWTLHFYFLRCALLFIFVRAEEVFNTTPPTIRTSFSCYNRPMGFYADVEANCRVYHTCDDHGNKFSYRCPEETAFRQDALICDHAHLVDCQATVYPANRLPDENTGNKNNAAPPLRQPITSIDSPDDHRLSFSRSFQVVQRPDKSVPPNKLQSGFVFSASLFLRDHDRPRDRAASRTADTSRRCNVDSKDRFAAASTVRTFTERFNSWDVRNDKSNRARPQSLSLSETRDFARDKSATVNFRRSFEPTPSPSTFTRPTTPDNVAHHPAFPREKSTFLTHDHNYHPYSETLKSIQANSVRAIATDKSTTEIPVHALTLSLKPLVPNELEFDPYYPRQPTSTEAYYTPSHRNGFNANAHLPTSSQVPPVVSSLNLPFEIPPVLPDLNSLEDLVDRRKLFYIPRVNVRST